MTPPRPESDPGAAHKACGDWPAVSVIVVSHGRPDLLPRCIASLRTQFHRPFEVIVVADAAGLEALAGQDDLKLARLDLPNISGARNMGLALAAAPVVAFLDDDAVARPDWLTGLVAGFALPGVAAVGGHVIGRNGFSYQWRTRQVDAQGQAADLEAGAGPVSLPIPDSEHAIKLEGTNCAFRTGTLRAMGGFDEGFHFYLDETDLCWRLHREGAGVAVVPGALVHHGFAASRRRTAARVPLDLAEIGASTMLYLRKHAPPGSHAGALARLTRDQHARLCDHLRAGRLDPGQVNRLMKTLVNGIAAGRGRCPTPAPSVGEVPTFKPFNAWGRREAQELLAGRPWQKKRLFQRASRLAGQGILAHVIILWPDARFHRRRFDARGFWVQEGGLFGRAERDEPLFRLVRFSRRVAKEAQGFAPP